MNVILDTDHCVEILRGRLNIDDYVKPTDLLFVTAITVGELIYGAWKSDKPEKNRKAIVQMLTIVTVLSFDENAGHRFGRIKDKLRRRGLPIAEPDVQIASIALHHSLPLATHNYRHFSRIDGLDLVDWLAPDDSS